MRRFALLGLLLVPAIVFAFHYDPTKEKPEAKATSTKSAARVVAPFALTDAVNGKSWDWKELKKPRAVVVVFLGTECPINNAYTTRLVELNAKYSKENVVFVGINSNSHDTPIKIAAHAKEHGLTFPVLKDSGNVVADQFGARRTPEAFVVSPEGTVLYQGRIDDQVGYNFKRSTPTRDDLAKAIDEVLAGKAVSEASTPVLGCLISRAMTPKTEGTYTFTKDVSRILQNKCQECHRPGQIGPMPLLTYEDALSWSSMIREVVDEKRMPPWHADPKHGTFANDRSLTEESRKALLGWIDQGCPKGDIKDLPHAKSYTEGWSIGKPDVVFSMPKKFTVPAKTGRNGIKYQYFQAETGFDSDMWVRAAEAKPGNRAVVHHIIVYVFNLKGGPKRERTADDIGDGFLIAWAPGDLGSVYPEGMAKKIPKGSTIVFQMHYTPNGVEQDDLSSVGLILSKEPPKYEVRTRSIAQRLLIIPPGESNYESRSASTWSKDAVLISLFPHMHLRGKDFSFRIVYPDDKTETLLSVPRYDFGWQANYNLKDHLKLPAGTRIECKAHFDNSDGNPNNPNPKSWVAWGDQTWEEMMIGFVDYYYLPEKK